MSKNESIPNKLHINNYEINKNDKFGLPKCVRYCLLNCKKEYILKLGYNINFNYKYGSFLITIKGFDNGDNIIKLFKNIKENYYFYSKKTLQDFSKSNINNVNNIIHQLIIKNQNNNFQINENFYELFKKKVIISIEEIEELNYYLDTIKKFINNKFINRLETYNELHYNFIFNFYLWRYYSYIQFYYQVIGIYNEFLLFFNNIKQKVELNWKEKIKTLFFYFEEKIYEQFGIISKPFTLKNNYEKEYDKSTDNKKNKLIFSQRKKDNSLDFENYIEEIKKNYQSKPYILQRNLNINYYFGGPDILIFSEINKNSAYYQAYNLLKEIIENINNESLLFELIYMIKSGTGNNKIKNEITFKMSLLSEEKIKNELNLLIPKFIFRESKNTNYNAYYSPYSKILLINENSYFNFNLVEGKEKLIINDDLNGKYTIPLLLLFLHEFLGQGKYVIKENLKFEKENLQTQVTLNYNKNLLINTENKGKFGRLIEFIISPYEEVIYYMKYSQDNFKELLNYKIWISDNMDEINLIVARKIIDTNFNFFEEKKRLHKKDYLIYFPIPSINEEELSESDEEFNFENIASVYDENEYINKYKSYRGVCVD